MADAKIEMTWQEAGDAARNALRLFGWAQKVVESTERAAQAEEYLRNAEAAKAQIAAEVDKAKAELQAAKAATAKAKADAAEAARAASDRAANAAKAAGAVIEGLEKQAAALRADVQVLEGHKAAVARDIGLAEQQAARRAEKAQADAKAALEAELADLTKKVEAARAQFREMLAGVQAATGIER